MEAMYIYTTPTALFGCLGGELDLRGFGKLSCGSPCVIMNPEKCALITTNDDNDVCRHEAIFIFDF